MKHWFVLFLGVVGGTTTAQEKLPVYEGPEAGPGVVRVLDVVPEMPLLRDVRLLPVEVGGASRLDLLRPDRVRVRADVPGASRLVLPAGQGSVYRYLRLAERRHGLFHVRADGTVRLLHELAGTGPLAAADPFVPGLAADPAGTTLWAATTLEAGGDLLEVDLASGAVVNRTAADEPFRFQARGLVLLPELGVAMTERGPLRLDRAGGPARPVPLDGGRATWYAADLVPSEDGSTFAFLAGEAPELTHVWCARAGGAAVRLSETTTGLSSAGFLSAATRPTDPENKGPWLALSTDGSACAWIQDGESRELFVRPVPATGSAASPPAQQVTHDARFADTLNDSGVIAFFSPLSLVALVGDASGSRVAKIEEGDFYRVDVDPTAGGLGVSNLTLTSGDGVSPFLEYGTLGSAGGVFRRPDGKGLFTFDDEARRVLTVDWEGRVQPVLTDVLALDDLFPLGDDVVLQVQLARPAGAAAALAVLRAATDEAELVAELAPGATFRALALDGARALGGIASFGPGREWLGRIDFLTGETSLLTTQPLAYAAPLGFSPAGALVVSVLLGEAAYYGSWSADGSFAPIAIRDAASFCLPAR